MLCIYFSLSVQCTLILLLQLKQTPTDSSCKPSFKKKDRPWTEKQRYKPYRYSTKFRGDRCSYEVDFFSSSGSLGASPQHYNAVFFILVFVFHFLIFLYYYFVSHLKEKTRSNVVVFNVACTPVQNRSSSTTEFRFLGTKLTIDSYLCDSSTPPPNSECTIYCGKI